MQKAKGPQRKAFRDSYLAAIIASAFLLCSISSNAQIFGSNWGTGFRRLFADSTLYFPTGCGVPSGIASLHSVGFGNGEKKRMAAIYADTCGHKVYWFDWTDSAWIEFGSGSGGSGTGFSFRTLTSTDFSSSTNCPLPALNNDSLQIFWNDLGRFLVKGSEWVDLAGGGFTVTLPGFDATSSSYSFNVYSSPGTLTPGPLPYTSADFSTATNCPISALNGMTLQIFWNDLNRYLIPGTEWTPLAGGGFTVTIPGFDASSSSYSFYVFNQ